MNEQLELADVIPASLAITAMRDSGYKNTAYALAELIDNAVQAEASLVQVVCQEQWEEISTRRRRRIQSIGVLDNGIGMDAETLRLSLQFGNGTRLNDRSGIGRFGMGLPNASISQAGRVEVWTWQNGVGNALYSYLDVREIQAGRLRAVPRPELMAPPSEWLEHSSELGETGTLVVWSEIDQARLTWKTAKATLENTSRLAGRVYRKRIHSGEVDIQLIAEDDENEVQYDQYVEANDPMYLIAPSDTPAPFGTSPMFQQWGERDQKFVIPVDDRDYEVVVRISWAKQETVPEDGTDRGSKPYGKHAARNVGVSLMRADREIDLDSSWARSYEPTERWWGVEVDFPPGLDEVFGLTNNKQSANIFSHMARFDWEQEAEEGETFLAFKERLREQNDPRVHLIDIVDYIRTQLTEVRNRLSDQTKGTRGGGKTRHSGATADDKASSKFKERAAEGHHAEGDRDVFDEKAREDLVRDLTRNKHYPEKDAREIADAVKRRERKTIFLEAFADSYALFQVEQRPGGITEIVFNRSHPAFDKLVSALDTNTGGATDADLVDRIHDASDTLRLLFAAWARYEIEDVPNRARVREARHEWGKMARVFLEDSSE